MCIEQVFIRFYLMLCCFYFCAAFDALCPYAHIYLTKCMSVSVCVCIPALKVSAAFSCCLSAAVKLITVLFTYLFYAASHLKKVINILRKCECTYTHTYIS